MLQLHTHVLHACKWFSFTILSCSLKYLHESVFILPNELHTHLPENHDVCAIHWACSVYISTYIYLVHLRAALYMRGAWRL